MAAEFHSFWGRSYLVDEVGVREFNESGEVLAMIRWQELESVMGGLRAITGTRICVRLSKNDTMALFQAVRKEWKSRHPEAYRRHRERSHRKLRMGLTIVYPSLFILMDFCWCFGYWWLGRPPIPDQIRWPMIRVQASILVMSALSWAIYLFIRWSINRSDKREIENQQKTSEVLETSEVC